MKNLTADNTKKSPAFLKSLLFGLIIGIAAIMPGLSGGVLAISLGVYADTIDALTKLRREFKKSFLYLLPLGLGAVMGLVAFGFVMKPLLENFLTTIIWLFAGMIIGSIPSLVREASEGGFRAMFILPLLITFAVGLLISDTVSGSGEVLRESSVLYFLGGVVLVLGIIVPGISSSFVLIQMGVYDKIITSFTELDFGVMLWVGLGGAVCFLAGIYLINLAFKKFRGYAYFASMGFLASTLISVIPDTLGVVDIILFLAGGCGVYLFMRKKDKE